MTTFTYRVTVNAETNAPEAWIDADGQPAIFQPHHPAAVGGAPWESEADATEWAAAYCTQLAADEQVAIDAQAAAEAAAVAAAAAAQEDRDRLIRIEAMLTQLLNK